MGRGGRKVGLEVGAGVAGKERKRRRKTKEEEAAMDQN